QGHLYGSVTQNDIAAALTELGYNVKPREVRLPHTIKRVDMYEVLVKFDSDLEANVKTHVVADRKLDLDRDEEMDFDNEGNLIEPGSDQDKKSKKEADGKPIGAGMSTRKIEEPESETEAAFKIPADL
ncbi:MAG: 50S ribosomal L9 C-terminal domain-containing protein, partial [Planctomycetota bacterium]